MIEAATSGTPYRVSFTNGASTAAADVPPDKGGGGAGFRPHELLEAALATCMAMTAQMYAREHALPLRGATARVTLDRTRPGEAAFECALELEGDLSAGQRQALREAVQNCPVGQTLARRVTVRLG